MNGWLAIFWRWRARHWAKLKISCLRNSAAHQARYQRCLTAELACELNAVMHEQACKKSAG